jgi:hypothetical protein
LLELLAVLGSHPDDEQSENRRSNLARKKRGHGIADLNKLLRAIALEKVIIRKSLQASSLPDCQAAALRGIGMDEVMTVLGDVTGDGCRSI